MNNGHSFWKWITPFFLAPDDGESIMGDLEEEFSTLAAEQGTRFAQSWYRRQACKTALHSVTNAVRNAPLQMLVTVACGIWLLGFATRWSAYATRIILDAHRVYELHPGAYLWWSKFPFELGRLILAVSVGAIVALVTKKKELPAVITLAFVQMAMFLTGAIALVVQGHEWTQWFIDMAPWNTFCAIATIAGGMIVQQHRRRTPASVPPNW